MMYLVYSIVFGSKRPSRVFNTREEAVEFLITMKNNEYSSFIKYDDEITEVIVGGKF